MNTYGYGRVEGDLNPSRLRIPRGQAPPLLTTSLNNAHNLQHGLSVPSHQTPMSATTLSSPFSLHGASPHSASPNGPTAGTMSPMAYNPQEWAGGHHGGSMPRSSPGHYRNESETTVYAPRLQGPDEPVRSPPPPYTTDPIDASPAGSTPSNQFSPAYIPSSASTISAQTSPLHSHPGQLPPPPPPPPATSAQHNAQGFMDGSRPPGARRAASTGDMHRNQPARSPLGLHSETPQARQGYALPPPPPGPPPGTSRSMSLNRAGESAAIDVNLRPAPRTRRPPAWGTELDTVPPTPANWEDGPDNAGNDGDYISRQAPSRGAETLSIRTEGLAGPQPEETIPPSATRTRKDSFSLVRSPAVRNRSASALRERRSASRAGRVQSPDTTSPGSDDPLSHPLDNLILHNKNSVLAERRRSGRFTPKSGGGYQALDATVSSAKTPPHSARSLGKPPVSAKSNVIEQIVEENRLIDTGDERTPPARGYYGERKISSARASPRQPLSATSQLLPPSAKSTSAMPRPVSHLLHTPNDDVDLKVQPLSPESTHSLMEFGHEAGENEDESFSEDLFVAQSVERHRHFIEQEAGATSDEEKLQLFVQFMLQESQLRRVRYAEVFEEDKVSPNDLVQGMFTLPPQAMRPSSQAISYSSKRLSSRGAGRRCSASSSGTSFADSPLDRSRSSTIATSDMPLKLDTNISDTVRKREGAFVPALSPIASMSAVTGRDDMESRGRSASRWWEEGSNSSGRGFDVMGRSKRESKYMSALIENEPVQPERGGAASSSMPPPQYDGPNEYPPEKGGISSQLTPTFLNTPAARRAPFENRPGVLDVSHFTTLPPPYPRRHPAVNNNHPDLADTRAILRSLNDLQEAEVVKAEYEKQSGEKRSRADSWSQHQASMHEQEMQFRISQQDITRQEYDDARFALEDRLHTAKKQAIQNSFDLYQKMVVTPVHSFLSTRIAIANNTVDNMTSRLLERSSTPLPDQPQTEGDSQPELLERLTLLKWLFEAREALHKHQFDIISKRNELYRELVLVPYDAPGAEDNPANTAKKAEAMTFFAKDLKQREQEAADQALTRWTMFNDTIHSAVEVGVQSQLSAFWDIAPQLQELLQRVPSDTSLGKRPEGSASVSLADFEILIPRHEVDENEAYWDHPLRYLFSVMVHAEASTRQFVDAQISLCCLEQEIREGLVRAQSRADGNEDRAARAIKRGVDELKDKVSVVEGQWAEGLGAEFERVHHGVREYLENTDGWDEELEEQIM